MTQQTKSPYRRPSKRNPAHSYATQEADAAPKPNGYKRRYASEDDEFDLDEGTPPAVFTGDPAAVIPKGERLVIQGKTYFKPAHHQRTIPAHVLGRFGVARESDYGFKVLRDPRTGHPVVRDHGDLKPGEVSLVLE